MANFVIVLEREADTTHADREGQTAGKRGREREREGEEGRGDTRLGYSTLPSISFTISRASGEVMKHYWD